MKLLLEAWKQFTEGMGPSRDEWITHLVYDEHLHHEVWERLGDNGGLDAKSAVPLNFDLPLTDEQREDSDLDQRDKDEILKQIINDLVDKGLVGKVGNDLYYSIGD